MQISVRFPVLEVDGMFVALVLGRAEAEFGDEVSLEPIDGNNENLASLFVAAVDSAPAHAIDGEVLALFGLTDTDSLVRSLERAYGTGLRASIPITIYTLADRPVEETAE